MPPSESVQIVAEYAKSKMSSCKKCSEFIPAKTLRLGLVSRDPRGFDLTKWHHLGCFSEKIGSTEEIIGFASLKENDQEALKKLISGVKDVVEENRDPASKGICEIGDEHKNPSMPPSKAVDILAEYAKSKRSSCKKCSEFIEAKSLRLGVVSRDRGFDMTKWYHLDCFSDKVESAEEIIGFASLKENDQEALKKLVSGFKRHANVDEGSPDSASKRRDESGEDHELNGKISKKRKKNVENPPSKAVEILAEYAKSKRSSCQTCSEFIEAKTLRLGLVSKDRGFDMTKWYHLDCFSEKVESTDRIIGFASLKENDQEALKKLASGFESHVV